MSTLRKPTVDDLYDQRYHNQPESGTFSSHEYTTLEAGRSAWQSLRKTFDQWVAIGRAVKLLREKADRDGRRQTFKILMAQQGFSMDGKPEDGRVLQKARVTRLLHIMENLAAVQAWHEKLSPFQQIEWSSPDAVYRHCPVFAAATPADKDKPLSPYGKLKLENIALQEENARLGQDDVGDVILSRAANGPDNARILLKGLGEDKCRALLRALTEQLKALDAEFTEANEPKKRSARKTPAAPKSDSSRALVWQEDRNHGGTGHSHYKAQHGRGIYTVAPMQGEHTRFAGYIVEHIGNPGASSLAARQYTSLGQGTKSAAKAKALAQEHADANPVEAAAQ